jgi:hypothetical protein
MYFKNFQKIYYDYNINGEKELKVVTDITKNVRFRKEVLSNISAYDYYDIKDGETPEIIAEKIYGNPEYHWIIMLANDKYDYLSDFPLDTHKLEKFITDKYDDKVYGIHHYENGKGLVVDSSYPGAVSVSNYDYEIRINESKRKIKIVSKDIINLILTNLSNL